MSLKKTFFCISRKSDFTFIYKCMNHHHLKTERFIKCILFISTITAKGYSYCNIFHRHDIFFFLNNRHVGG